MKTFELQGPALDWAVAKCEGHEVAVAEGTGMVIIRRNNVTDYFNPSSNWSWAGPIIEKEKIGILFYVDHIPDDADEPIWVASCGGTRALGDTPLIAAMRCYVMLELANGIDIPKELK